MDKPELKLEKIDVPKLDNKQEKNIKLLVESKTGTDEDEESKTHIKVVTKAKKPIDIPISITPKSYTKSTLIDKGNKNVKINKKNLTSSLTSQLKYSQGNINVKDSIETKKLYGINNPNCEQILSNFQTKLSLTKKNYLNNSFFILKNLKNNEFFSKFYEMKKSFKDFISNVDNIAENYTFMLKFFENSINQINNKLRISITEDMDNLKANVSNLSDDMIVEYHYKKNNAVYFEIPIKERAMSLNFDHNIGRKEKLDKKFLQKPRQTSAEIEKHINRKLETAQKNKENIKKQFQENVNKLMNKILQIKKMKKREKEEKFQKIIEKSDNFEKRHKQFLEERTSRARNEQEKVAEINFINRIDKENRSYSLLKKLDISIGRRKNYMIQKLSKTLKRNHREEEVENRRKQNLDEKVQKLNQKLLKASLKKSLNLKNNDKISIMQKLEIANKRKEKIDEKYEFIKNIYSENFIYQLIEADFFEIEDLYELTNLTKFEIIKAKLKKDKEKIDKMYENKKKNQLKNTKKSSVNSGVKSILSSENSCFDENKNFVEDDSQSEKDSFIEATNKLSRSFTYTNQRDDFSDVFNETIQNLPKPEENQKKKKKKKTKEKVSLNIKRKLIKTLNSLSNTELGTFFRKVLYIKIRCIEMIK